MALDELDLSCKNETSFYIASDRITCKSNYASLCEIPIFSLSGVICRREYYDNEWTCSNPKKSWIRYTELICPEDITNPACDFGRCFIEFNPIYTIYYVLLFFLICLFVFGLVLCTIFLCIITQCCFSIENSSPSVIEGHLKIKRPSHRV